jgi:antagonist of KipI
MVVCFYCNLWCIFGNSKVKQLLKQPESLLMSFTVIKPGLLDTIQDAGRTGYAAMGINPGGVMDKYAAQVSNMLVGNDLNEPVIEIHFPGPQLLFEQNTLISVCGADFTPLVNNEPLNLWQPHVIRKNNILQFGKKQKGSRCYIAVHGGMAVEQWLGSSSTHLRAGVGGYRGRKLDKGDELVFKESTIYFPSLMKEGKDIQSLHWIADAQKVYAHPHEIAFVAGHEWNALTRESQTGFLENNFMIHPFSDRMGYQLKGVTMELTKPVELVSSGVSFGTIQLLPNGQLVVLMADHQTTGGYPRVGHVISAHLPKLAQLSPSDNIHFTQTTVAAAEQLLCEHQRDCTVLQRACQEHLNALLCNVLT